MERIIEVINLVKTEVINGKLYLTMLLTLDCLCEIWEREAIDVAYPIFRVKHGNYMCPTHSYRSDNDTYCEACLLGDRYYRVFDGRWYDVCGDCAEAHNAVFPIPS